MSHGYVESEPKLTATISIEEAQSKLRELVMQLAPGDEIIITNDAQPVARLVSQGPKERMKARPAPGLGRGSIIFMASDFDAPLDEFKEYVE